MSSPSTESADVGVRVAVRLLEADRLSLGRAAELAGQSVPEFVHLLGHGDVPFLDTEAEPEAVAA